VKTAKPHVTVIELTCPECGEHLSAANGSHSFVEHEPMPAVLECEYCGITLGVPKRPFGGTR